LVQFYFSKSFIKRGQPWAQFGNLKRKGLTRWGGDRGDCLQTKVSKGKMTVAITKIRTQNYKRRTVEGRRQHCLPWEAPQTYPCPRPPSPQGRGKRTGLVTGPLLFLSPPAASCPKTLPRGSACWWHLAKLMSWCLYTAIFNFFSHHWGLNSGSTP
jgi:hypothetical protein